jgi:hypothetical protein
MRLVRSKPGHSTRTVDDRGRLFSPEPEAWSLLAGERQGDVQFVLFGWR